VIQGWSHVHNARPRAWNRPGSVGERSRAWRRRRPGLSVGYVDYALERGSGSHGAADRGLEVARRHVRGRSLPQVS
jgi:hypothetical protein